MTQKLKNNARSLLVSSILAGDTSLVVESGKADLFPVADTGTDPVGTFGKDWFKAVLQDTAGNIEIIYVRTRPGGNATFSNIQRGQEGTTARDYAAGSVVGLRITSKDVEDAISLASSATATGTAIVGAANQAAARAAISAAVSGANSDITSLSALASVNGGQLAGMRNKIINGKMEIAQRGTSFPAIVSAVYSIDRWLFGNTSAAVLTASQQADVPSDNEFQNSLRLAVTTADASIAAGDVTWWQQRIEGYNVRDLISRTFALSFWVRSSKTGTHCVCLMNSAADRSYVAEYTVSAANTWEKKTITVSGGLITAGTWNWTNGIGLNVQFVLACGSNFQTTAGAWQTGAFYATANQVNCLDTIGNIFAITGVQLEVGSVATPFEHRPIGMELALCQRYYQRLRMEQCFNAAGASNTLKISRVPIVPLRSTPTFTQIQAGTTTNASAANLVGLSTEIAESVLTAAASGDCFVTDRIFETSGTEL